jgi:hypothetical protein
MNEVPAAFPWTHDNVTCTGMTLRDYFAAKAMQTMISYRRNYFEKDNEREALTELFQISENDIQKYEPKKRKKRRKKI